VTLDPYNAFLHRADADGDWRVGVKDVIDVAGMPTTAASKILHRVPDRDAECVARLRAAGATITGKLNTHEFAFGALTNSPHFGPALNPWDTERATGGSSGGSGAAVAAGSSTSRSEPTPPDRSGSRRRSAASRATGRPSVSCRSRASSPSPGPSMRSARSPAPRRSAAVRWRSWPAGRSTPGDVRGSASSPGCSRRPTPRSRPLRGSCRRAPGRRAGRAPAARGDRDDHAARHAPGGGRRHLRGCGRASPTTGRTSARACSPGCCCRRRPTSPACGPKLGAVAVGAELGGFDLLVAPGDADRRAAPGRDPGRLPAADHAVQLAGVAARAPGHVVPCGFVDGLPVGLR
jgi:hypothetical protein